MQAALTGVFVLICYWIADIYHMFCDDILERVAC